MAYIGNTAEQQAFTPAIDYFNGNGSTVAFTLSRPVASVAQVQAVIENVPQNPGDAFTVSGNTITFTSAPPSGTSNIYVYYTSPITQVVALPQSPQVFGNLQFSSTGARITGDMSNATALNRVAFQTSTTNSQTAVLAIPNGTSGTAQWQAYNNSDTTNSSFLGLAAVGSTDTRITSGIVGTGTFLPLTMYTGGSERMRIDTSGNVGIGTNSPAAKLQLSGGAAQNQFFVNTSTSVGSKLGGSYFYSSNTNDGWYSGIDAFVTAGSPGIDRTDLRFYTTSVTAQERMRLTSGGDLQFNSGYGSVATAYGCRAWVNFNGAGTVAIRASGNVSSVTDLGTGSYRVNFSTSMPDINYASVASDANYGITNTEVYNNNVAFTPVFSYSINGVLTDTTGISVAIFR